MPAPTRNAALADHRTRDAVLEPLPASIRERLQIYVDLLLRWQRTINLVAPSTLPDLWTRHVADSKQVSGALPQARRWVDLGSGGGFPGMVTAILLSEQPDAQVDLVESDRRKAAFLHTVSRETGAPAVIHATRIAAFMQEYDGHADAVSARALAPLAELITYSRPLLDRGATGVFLKGRTADAELTAAKLDHRYRVTAQPSRTDSRSSLLIVRAHDLESGGGSGAA
jgi:16S rRNA (guanine527-N7)-methyltransferase